MAPVILRSITVDEEEAAILIAAAAALKERTDLLSDEGRAVLEKLRRKGQAVFDDIVATKARRGIG